MVYQYSDLIMVFLLFQFVLACLVAVAAAARLDNTYLPPAGAGGAGGSGSILSGPHGGGANGAGGRAGSGGGARSAEANAKILRFDNNNDGLGSYSYQYVQCRQQIYNYYIYFHSYLKI